MLQFLPGGAVAYDQELQIVIFLPRLSKQGQQLSQILFAAQTSQVQQHLVIVPNAQRPSALHAGLMGQPLMVLLQRNAAGDHVDGGVQAVALQGVLHLLGGSHQSIHVAQALPGQELRQKISHPLAGDKIGGQILLVQGVIGMYQGRAGDPGDPLRELEAEKFALAVDDVRLPVDDLLDQLITVGGGHPQVRVHCPQGHGTDVIHRAVFMRMKGVGNGEDPHIVSLLGQFVKEILHTGDHAVGGGGVQIRGDQHFQSAFLLGHNLPPETSIPWLIISDFSQKSTKFFLRFLYVPPCLAKRGESC